MITFSPMSEVRLLNVPFDKSYKNVLHFSTKAKQSEYFLGRQVKLFTDYSYIRKDNVIRVSSQLDDLWNCNYAMYQNENFSSKYFYAFITDKKYISESCTELTIKTDVFQTWFFDVSFKKSFVEREHVDDDSIGEHIIDEGLATGEYIERERVTAGITDLSILVGLSDLSPLYDDESDPTGDLRKVGGLYGGMYSGLSYWAFPLSMFEGDETNVIDALLQAYTGKTDAIVFMCMIPSFAVNNQIGRLSENVSYGATKSVTITRNFETVSGYTPKNNKLFTYPYTVLYVSNNEGEFAEYKYENFPSGEFFTFNICGDCNPNPTVKCFPMWYAGSNLNAHEHALTLKNYPFCSWNTDIFKNWLAQNSVSMGINMLSGTVAMGGSAVTGNVLGSVGGLLSITNQLSQMYKESIQPDQAKGNTTSGSFNVSWKLKDFYFYKYQIKQDYAKVIDDYFTMYGYKVNSLKVPELTSRPNWNYVKTIDINVTGNIANDDLVEFKEIFNTGVTLWHNPSTIYDYSQENGVIENE